MGHEPFRQRLEGNVNITIMGNMLHNKSIVFNYPKEVCFVFNHPEH